MKVHEILIEAPKDPKGVVFEIFTRMLPDEITKASLKQVDDALRWLAKTAKSNPTVAEDIAASLVAGSKQMGISVREMAQMAEPHLVKAGIDPYDIYQAKQIAEKLAEPSMWQKFKDAVGVGAKKDPKAKPEKIEPTLNPTTPPGPTPTPTPGPTTPPAPAPTPGPATTVPAGSTRISQIEASSITKNFMEKYNPARWGWWQRADAIAMTFGIIEPWYAFKKEAEEIIALHVSQAKDPNGKPWYPTKESMSKDVTQAAQEAMGKTLALLAGRKLIGVLTRVNALRALPKKTQEEFDILYSKMGAKAQVAFAAWLDTPPGREVLQNWLWEQMYSQGGSEDEMTPTDLSTKSTAWNSFQGNVAWALRQVSALFGGGAKSLYDAMRRFQGLKDTQGNDAAAAAAQQQAASDAAGGVLNTTTERK